MFPLISIIIPTYNRYDECIRAIESALCQDYKPINIIVVEDGSASGIKEWIQGRLKSDARIPIKYFNNEKNLGLAATKNNGIKSADGDYVAILDDDDEWKANKLSVQMMSLKDFLVDNHDELAIVTSAVEVRDEAGIIEYITPCGNSGRLKDDIIANGIKTPSSTFLMPRKAVLEIGGYDESLRSSTDHDMMMSLASQNFFGVAVHEALAINYSRVGRNTNMTNTKQRLISVDQFLKKWTPTIENWLGVKKAKSFCKIYFAKVGTILFINKLLSGNFFEAVYCIGRIFSRSGFGASIIKVVFFPTFKAVLKLFLPKPLIRKMKGLS